MTAFRYSLLYRDYPMSQLLVSKLNAVRRKHAAVALGRAVVGVLGLLVLFI